MSSCSVCSSGSVIEKEEFVPIYFYGEKGRIKSRFSVCEQCGEFATSAQVRFNASQMREFKDSVLNHYYD